MTDAWREPGGFSLVEALIALTLSTVVVLLVASVFLVQNEFYGMVAQRTEVHENARSVTDLVSSAVRKVAAGGVMVADSARLVIRLPQVHGAVCARVGSDAYIHLHGGPDQIDSSLSDGYGIYDWTDETWDYTAYSGPWSDIYSVSAAAKDGCGAQGADTAGATGEYIDVADVDWTGLTTGDIVMIYTETEYLFAPSALRPGDTSLYVGQYGGTLREYATGMAPDAHFDYRTGGATYTAPIASSSLGDIDGVRIWARARAERTAGTGRDVDYGWATDVPLWNSIR